MKVDVSVGRSVREYARVTVEAESVEMAEAYVQAMLTGETPSDELYDVLSDKSWEYGADPFDEDVIGAAEEEDQDEDTDVTVPEGWQAPAASTATLAVEFLRAWEDGTWDTLRVSVPVADLAGVKVTKAGDDDETLTRWAGQHLRDQVEHRKVVTWAVYSVNDPECGTEAR